MPPTILLYYKYVQIDNAEALRDEQRVLCTKLGLKGRIIISKEGINGTVEGTQENTELYIGAMQKDPRFADIDFKKSPGTGNAFPKLSIKARSEIVTLGSGTADVTPDFKRGDYISPDELQKLYDNKEDFVVIDMRNDYEHAIGYFENSIRLPIKYFKEIPEAIEDIADKLQGKKIVSVCTGGVRCEKATGYLVERGFENVYQLEGGMVRYLEKHPGKKFKGSLYVFDGRIAVSYDTPETHEIVGRCHHCDQPTERYTNCEYVLCHNHIISCDDCFSKSHFCTEECEQNAQASLASSV
jgi:UPF0176 protein